MVVANWKMNPPTFREAKTLFDATRKSLDSAKNVSLIVVPPAVYLRELAASYKGAKIMFGIQNAFYEKSGAHTGEISLLQAKDAKVRYVIIGHSERRAFGESNDDTRKKVAATLAVRMSPIVCVGEMVRSQNGEHFNFVRDQLRAAFLDVPKGAVGRVTVAYEPVWAIGHEKGMPPHDMHEMAIFIRKTLVEQHGEKAMNVKILYGGSVNEMSAPAMMRDGDVQGLLIGHVSVDIERFHTLLLSL